MLGSVLAHLGDQTEGKFIDFQSLEPAVHEINGDLVSLHSEPVARRQTKHCVAGLHKSRSKKASTAPVCVLLQPGETTEGKYSNRQNGR